MIVYIITFIITITSTWLAERSTKQKLAFIILSSIAILIPSLIAGFRDSGIGTDTQVYVDDTWNKIIQITSWSDLIKNYNQGEFESIEPIYLFINWCASIFGKDIHYCYFITNLSVILPIFCAIYNNRKKAPMWLSMTIFLFLYYNASLNLVRQSIALSFCIYAYKYLEQNNWKKLLIWSIIIINTHNTGIFYILFIFLYLIWNLIKKGSIRSVLIGLYFTILPILLLLFNYIVILAIYIGILPTKYLIYLSEDNYGTISKSTFFIYIAIFIVFFYIKKNTQYSFLEKKTINYFFYSKFFGIILLCASYISKWAFRISYYFNYPIDCIFLPQAIYSIRKKNKSIYNIISLSLICILIIMWYWLIVIRNEHETIPYKSHILGI